MSAVTEAYATLLAALGLVPGVRVYADSGAVIDPPALVLGPPSLVWNGFMSDPTAATFTVTAVVRSDDRALGNLLELLPAVAEVVDSVQDAVVTRAEPGSFSAGGTELPAYVVTVEMSV